MRELKENLQSENGACRKQLLYVLEMAVLGEYGRNQEHPV
jgi:hypothetical protein